MTIKIAESRAELDFDQRQVVRVKAGDKWVSVAQVGDRLFAFADKCPHAGGCLSAGWINPLGNIVCPLHRYTFDVTNGRNTSGEGYYLKRWPIEETDDGIFLILS
ncbi:MAG: Rieske 2Fe-2S domain-containing protein [Bacteroidetes bacterium]|nr:Rieske 2Fe-2S domain-containing protein [Bacteroidota bacterium]